MLLEIFAGHWLPALHFLRVQLSQSLQEQTPGQDCQHRHEVSRPQASPGFRNLNIYDDSSLFFRAISQPQNADLYEDDKYLLVKTTGCRYSQFKLILS